MQKSIADKLSDQISFSEEEQAFLEKELIHHILNNVNNLIFVANKENRFVYINEIVIEKYGYTRQELLKMSIGDIDINFDENKHDDCFWEMFAKKKVIKFNSIHKDKNQNLHPVLIHANYIEYEGQIYNFGVVEDESYIQKLLDAHDGFIILTDGKQLVMTNAQLLEFVGYKNFQTFQREHKCICDFFIEEDGFIYNHSTWIEDIKHVRYNDAKVKIKNVHSGIEHIFLVRASAFDEYRSLVTFTDITELEHYKIKLEHLALTDGLTSLYNRRYFNKIFPQEINRAKRDKKYLAFMMIDIDFFKQYNDTYGHINGDDVLIHIADTIKKHFCRASDFCFRLGGEEFGIISTGNTLDDVIKQTEQLRIGIEALNIEHKKSSVSNYVTISMGFAFSDGSQSFETVFSEADAALYKAKDYGRNRVVYKEGICYIDSSIKTH